MFDLLCSAVAEFSETRSLRFKGYGDNTRES